MANLNHKKLDALMEQAIHHSMISQTRERDNPGGGPFGAVIADMTTYQVHAKGNNRVLKHNNPLLHAEIEALYHLPENCPDIKNMVLVSSCEPCPMCLHAIERVGIEHVIYANTQTDAANIGFDDQDLYDELLETETNRKIHFTYADTKTNRPDTIFAEIINAQNKVVAKAHALSTETNKNQLKSPLTTAIEEATDAIKTPHLDNFSIHLNYIPDYFEQSVAYWSHIYEMQLENVSAKQFQLENARLQANLNQIISHDENAHVHVERIKNRGICQKAITAFEGYTELCELLAKKQGIDLLY